MLLDAKDSMSLITEEQLEEIQTYKKPPDRIKMALEGIYLLLEGKVYPWKTIVKKMAVGDFVSKVMNMKLKKIKAATMAKFKKGYLKSKLWDIEKLKKASQAMGPLGAWL